MKIRLAVEADKNRSRGSYRPEFKRVFELHEPSAMRQLARHISNLGDWFRACKRCGSLIPPVDIFCSHCWRSFENIRPIDDHPLRGGYDFPVYSLVSWTPENDSLLRPLIYGLKGGQLIGAWTKLAWEFSCQRRYAGPISQPSIFVVPPRKTTSVDHAFVFASALSSIWDIPVLDIIQVAGDLRQKLRSVAARKKLQLCLKPSEDAESYRHRHVVFIDDVVTTGATASAVYRALGEPKGFEVWSLVSRPKLAGSLGI